MQIGRISQGRFYQAIELDECYETISSVRNTDTTSGEDTRKAWLDQKLSIGGNGRGRICVAVLCLQTTRNSLYRYVDTYVFTNFSCVSMYGRHFLCTSLLTFNETLNLSHLVL